MTHPRLARKAEADVARLRQEFADLGKEHGSAGIPQKYALVEYREAYDTAREKRRRGDS